MAAVLVTLFAAARVYQEGAYLLYLLTKGDIFDTWALLSLLEVLLAMVGITAAWLCFGRKKLALACVFLILPLPIGLVIEASRCDVEAVCNALGWASLPPQAFDWQLRVRDVDIHAAEHIANGALLEAKLRYVAWRPRLDAGTWRLETRTPEWERGRYDVLVDAETGRTRLVPR